MTLCRKILPGTGGKMADAIARLTIQNGGCIASDLRNEGFSNADIARHMDAAFRHAQAILADLIR